MEGRKDRRKEERNYPVGLYLLRVLFCERQHGGHVEHHFPVLVLGVHGLQASLPVLGVQASPEPKEEKTHAGYTLDNREDGAVTL